MRKGLGYIFLFLLAAAPLVAQDTSRAGGRQRADSVGRRDSLPTDSAGKPTVTPGVTKPSNPGQTNPPAKPGQDYPEPKTTPSTPGQAAPPGGSPPPNAPPAGAPTTPR